MFRQTQQLPGGGETLDQFHARLLQLSKNCNFVNRDGEIRSQIIQKCAMAKIRDKGLSEADITLEQLTEAVAAVDAELPGVAVQHQLTRSRQVVSLGDDPGVVSSMYNIYYFLELFPVTLTKEMGRYF